jgi:prolyl-tRNA synthetase
MVVAESGEDLLAHCAACGYAGSLAVAECNEKTQRHKDTKTHEELKEVDTPGVSTIEKVGAFLKVKPDEMVKTLIYMADDKPVAVLIRGDHDANEAKVKKYLKCAKLDMASEDVIKKVTGGAMGFSGPVGLKETRIIADNSIKGMINFVTGANKKDTHYVNTNIDRDFKISEWADLRMITEKDQCPKCDKGIKIEHAIEMGHVFKLGLKYSKAMEAEFSDEDGKLKPIVMGCYGIGVNRIMAAAIELNNDDKGIIWPLELAPFQVTIIPLNYGKENIRSATDELYNSLESSGIEVLLDDRNESAGIKFNDAELIGTPFIIVIGDRGLKKGVFEVKTRKTGNTIELKIEEMKEKLPALLKSFT